jgi:hypothetical protein
VSAYPPGKHVEEGIDRVFIVGISVENGFLKL